MTTIDTVYRDGAFHPAVPPDLAEGTAVTISVPDGPSRPVGEPLVGADLVAYIRSRISAFDPATDVPTVTARNVDEVLYGGAGGVR